MKHATFFCLLLLATFTSLFAQMGEIQGKVTDALSGEPLPFANVNVILNGKPVGAQTDFDGFYSIKPLPPNPYTVRVAFVGYAIKEIHNVLVTADRITTLDIEMSESSVQLSTVQVVEYKTPVLQPDQTSTGATMKREDLGYGRRSRGAKKVKTDATKTGGTVTKEDIKNLPTKNVQSIASTTSGVYQADEGGALNVKGWRSEATDYYIDGIKVRGSSTLPSSAVDQMQVVTGGVPARYENGNSQPIGSPQNLPAVPEAPIPPPLGVESKPKDIIYQEEVPEEYLPILENEFVEPTKEPLSTFSIDVDKAAYSLTRRFLMDQNQLPPPGAVRTEELINYLQYDYPQPTSEHPFSITTEMQACPWNKDHQLLLIGLQGKNLDFSQATPNNLVFLVDVSGSMGEELNMVKEALKLLVDQMRPQDQIALTVYAGSAGLVLPPTLGNQKEAIKQAIDRLQSGGSTAGGAGINLAYKTATDNFLPNGNNRIILVTDGDFNVGTSSLDELKVLIEEKRKTNVFLSVLGVGSGNYQDATMELLADKGNGNYSYLGNLDEAKKVLVRELSGTLYTIAKDVKLQIEFNPVNIKGYRLVGYKNRMLAAEDFNDDKKDAGELGAGHSVTALYEILLHSSKDTSSLRKVDPLKYQTQEPSNYAGLSGEMMTVKFRYKTPTDSTSQLIEQSLHRSDLLRTASDNFKWAASVAELSLLLRGSKFKASASYEQVEQMANQAVGKDVEGERKAFVEMVKQAKQLGGTAAQK